MRHILCMALVMVFVSCAKAPKPEATVSTDTKKDSKTHKSKKAAKVDAPAAAATPALAPAPSASGEAGLTVKCTSGDDERVLQVTPKGKGCEVNYTKFGKTASIANAANGNDHCEDVVRRVQKKLEGAGYSCK